MKLNKKSFSAATYRSVEPFSCIVAASFMYESVKEAR